MSVLPLVRSVPPKIPWGQPWSPQKALVQSIISIHGLLSLLK